ncbi:flagellar basal-body rod protein FlgF [Deferribacterales bacterium RsTz2092]
MVQNGLYVATSGLLMQQQRLDVIANNLANVNTSGFKRDIALFSDYKTVGKRAPQAWVKSTTYNQAINSAVKLDNIVSDFQQGHFVNTDNKYDLALQNTKNFFTLETPWGLRYTRNGEFTLNGNGEIVSQDGYPLLDAETMAPIVIPQDALQVSIQANGAINVDGFDIGTVLVSQFAQPEKLQKVGYNLYEAVGILPQIPVNLTISQGYVEASNVEPIREMVAMIEAQRSFDMYQRAVSTYDDMNERTNSIVGR